ncbi:MAG: DUF2799 domain-containing protein [Bdellovibrionaceae bacterium]|nr:DUF2799 domain-containing protein [Pseudobdellovibrionaceae bacterium]
MKRSSLSPDFKIAAVRIALRLAMIAIGAYLFMNSGCVSIQAKQTCENIDWYEIGRQDGINGDTLDSWDRHAQACAGARTTPENDLYLNGRNAGLVEYCSPAGGLEAGKSGREYGHVCPEYLEDRFLPAYEVGRRIHLLEVENLDIEKSMNSIFNQLSRRTIRPPEESALQADLEKLRRRRATNEIQINDIEMKFIERL